MECPQCHQPVAAGAPTCPACGAALQIRPPLLRCLLNSIWQSKTGLILVIGGGLLVTLGVVFPPLGNILMELLSVFTSSRQSQSYSSSNLDDPMPLFLIGGGLVIAGLIAIGFTFANNYWSHPSA